MHQADKPGRLPPQCATGRQWQGGVGGENPAVGLAKPTPQAVGSKTTTTTSSAEVRKELLPNASKEVGSQDFLQCLQS